MKFPVRPVADTDYFLYFYSGNAPGLLTVRNKGCKVRQADGYGRKTKNTTLFIS